MKFLNLLCLVILTVSIHGKAARITDDNLTIGKPGSSANKEIKLGDKLIRSNTSSGKLEFSNDGSLFKNFGSGSGSGGEGGLNLILNSSFEDLTSNWTVVGAASFTIEDLDFGIEGNSKVAVFTATGADQCLESDLATVPNLPQFKGGCQLSVDYLGSGFRMNVVNASSTTYLGSGAVNLADTTEYTSAPLEPFFCPQAGQQLKARICSNVAGTLRLKSVYVGSNKNVANISPEITPWKEYGAITVSATTTAPTKGTARSVDSVRCRQVAEDYECEYKYHQSNAGAAGSGEYIFSLPNGIEFDDSVPTYTNLGDANLIADSAIGKIDAVGSATHGGSSGGPVISAMKYSSNTFRLNATSNFSSVANINSAFFHLGQIQSWYFAIKFKGKGLKAISQQIIQNPSVLAAETSFTFYYNLTTVVDQFGNSYPVTKSGTSNIEKLINVSSLNLANRLYCSSASANSPRQIMWNDSSTNTSTSISTTDNYTAGDFPFIITCSKTGSDYEAAKIYKFKTPILTDRPVISSLSEGTSNQLRTEFCRVNNAGSASIDTNSGLCAGWVQSVSRTSAGVVDLTMISGIFSSQPVCLVSANANTNACHSTISGSVINVRCGSSRSTTFDDPFSISCNGKR